MPKKTKRSAAQRAAWKKLPRWLKAKIRQNPLVEWSARVRREFEYKCAECGTNENLEAHHIYFKSEFPDRKLDLDNGICLCLTCHDKYHTLYNNDNLEYWVLVKTNVMKRVKIKRIKKRNKSSFNYFN